MARIPKGSRIIVFLALLCAFSGIGRGEGVALPDLMISYSSASMEQAALWVTQDGGFFARNGLPSRLILITSGSTSVQAMLGGDVQVGVIGTPAVLLSRLSGSDLVFFASLSSTLP